MRADERRVFFFDVIVKRLGKSSQLPSLSEIVDVWDERWKAQKAFHSRSRGDVLYLIGDIQVDRLNNTATILISIIDKAMPDAAYGNLDTREIKIFRKEEREGGNLSAHVTLSLSPEKTNTYLCLLEAVRRLSAANVQFLLNSLLRTEYKENESRFTFPHPGGAKTRAGVVRRQPYLPLISFGGHPSEQLIQDIENGTIRHLNFVQSREKDAVQFGDDPYLEEEAYQLTVGVKPDIPRENRWDRIRKAIIKRKADFSKGRITFLDPDDNLRNVDFDVEYANIENTQYIKSRVISKLDPPLADATRTIVPHLSASMLQILLSERGKKK